MLEEAVNLHDKNWTLVSAKLNTVLENKLTNSQCQKRWSQYLSPDTHARKTGPWSEKEVSSF